MTSYPGVYTMLDEAGTVIYIGKAKNLKKRLSSYFNRQLDNKTIQLVANIDSIQVTITRNEREALLLENSLIKAQRPRYNIIFKDDKSYPYIYISTQEKFPKINYHKGAKAQKGKYFGPYPSGSAVRTSIDMLQKVFKIRPCDDTFFKNRSRPCLQYQLKRCTAPCCDLISPEEYQQDVQNAILLLEGKDNQMFDALSAQMDDAVQRLEYERAIIYRDQIAVFKNVQKQQIILSEAGQIDVLGLAINHGRACVHVLYIRNGRMLGSRQYFPKMDSLEDQQESVLEAFIMQNYINAQQHLALPDEILLPIELSAKETLGSVLQESCGKSVQLKDKMRGDRLRWLGMAMQSAEHALVSKNIHKESASHRFDNLMSYLSLDCIDKRIECFDISHTFGESTVASCVVFNREGPLKSAYRRFNIKTVDNGDDYAAMNEALTRHYSRLAETPDKLPNILLMDGGKGQLSEVRKVFAKLEINSIMVLGVAKGAGRKSGLEKIIFESTKQVLDIPAESPAFHLIQQIRDEAHRFAITAHRKQRSKSRLRSNLDEIPGIGEHRRRQLILEFGSLDEVKNASLEELAKVSGINQTLAERIYAALHTQ